MQQYLPRIVDRELALRLEAFGATLIVGPKWCGKTTTGQQQAKSILRMQDPDKRQLILRLLRRNLRCFLRVITRD